MPCEAERTLANNPYEFTTQGVVSISAVQSGKIDFVGDVPNWLSRCSTAIVPIESNLRPKHSTKSKCRESCVLPKVFWVTSALVSLRFFSLPIDRIVYVTNFSAQYLYLIRRPSALSFCRKGSDDMGDFDDRISGSHWGTLLTGRNDLK